MKRTDKGYEYNGYAINRHIDRNMMTLCNQVWGWEIIDLKTKKNISPYLFETRREAKAYVDKLTEVNK